MNQSIPPLPNLPHPFVQRLASVQNDGPHDEFSRFDALTGLLCTYFTVPNGWMVKPKAAICMFADKTEAATAKTSMDAYHRIVHDTSNYKIADFIVCRYSADGQDDRLKLVIVVKPNTEDHVVRTGQAQLRQYSIMLLEGLDPHNQVGIVRGVLICGASAFLYEIVPFDGVKIMIPWSFNDKHMLDITQRAFWDFLHQCAHDLL